MDSERITINHKQQTVGRRVGINSEEDGDKFLFIHLNYLPFINFKKKRLK